MDIANHNILIITFTGQDQPGVTASVSKVLQEFQIEILDISQSVIHNLLTLSFIVNVESLQDSILKELLFRAHELNLRMKFAPLSSLEYESWVSKQYEERFVITILGRKIFAKHIAVITEAIARHGLNILSLRRLSERKSLLNENELSRACVELQVGGEIQSKKALKREFLSISHRLDIDVTFQVDDIFRRNRRLVAFDMDSTLIQAEVIDELAKAAGVGSEVIKITEAAMRGELDFNQSLERRVGLLKGFDVSRMQEIAENLPLTEGVEKLVSILKTFGYKVAVLSGGFTFFANYLKEKLGFDYVFANELEIIDNKLTGNVVGQIVDGERKKELLKKLAEQEGINMNQVIAVGDGANDLPMLAAAGLGIAFKAKPIVRENAEASVSNLGLDGILYLMGLRDMDIYPIDHNK